MKELLSYLYNLRNRGSVFGIERMKKMADLLDNPQNAYPIIHVAGTNGKGSVCSMLDSIYRENNYNVGLFTSPHLISLGERIRVNGQNISESEILLGIEKLKPIAQKLESEKEEGHPTFFEFMTALAFSFFREKKVDLAIIETGLGGRLDSTNIVDPLLSIITTISLDHCEILGNSLEEIAMEKAGIIKREKPVLIGWIPECTVNVFDRVAKKVESSVHSISNHSKDSWPDTNLHGTYQKQNAALALRATEILNEKLKVDQLSARNGLKKVNILGRWQKINGNINLILDACHNAAGAQCLHENLSNLGEKPQIWIGVLGEDRARDIMKVVCKYASSIKLFEVSQPRACSVNFLQSLIPQDFKGSVMSFDIQKAKEFLLKAKCSETILVTGSIYLIGDILALQTKQKLNQTLNLSDLF